MRAAAVRGSSGRTFLNFPRPCRGCVTVAVHGCNDRARGDLMRRLLTAIALLGLLALPAFASAQDLALKRVMLSSGGLGYFEYEAAVDGEANLKLTVSLDQVDDVLKSLVVYDDKGGVGGLS